MFLIEILQKFSVFKTFNMSTSTTKNSIKGGFSLVMTSSPTEAKQSLTMGNVEQTVTTNFETGERTMQEREISPEEEAEKDAKKAKKRDKRLKTLMRRQKERRRLLQERMNENAHRIKETAKELEEAKTREKTLQILERQRKRNVATIKERMKDAGKNAANFGKADSSEEDETSSEEEVECLEGDEILSEEVESSKEEDSCEDEKRREEKGVNLLFNKIETEGNVDIGGKFDNVGNLTMTFDDVSSKGNINIDFVMKGRKKR
jgi:hypothetical protein